MTDGEVIAKTMQMTVELQQIVRTRLAGTQMPQEILMALLIADGFKDAMQFAWNNCEAGKDSRMIAEYERLTVKRLEFHHDIVCRVQNKNKGVS